MSVQRSGCDVYTKAANVQSHGALGLVVVSEEKREVIELQLPSEMEGSGLNIPVVMMPFSAGRSRANDLRTLSERARKPNVVLIAGHPLMTAVQLDLSVKIEGSDAACTTTLS